MNTEKNTPTNINKTLLLLAGGSLAALLIAGCSQQANESTVIGTQSTQPSATLETSPSTEPQATAIDASSPLAAIETALADFPGGVAMSIDRDDDDQYFDLDVAHDGYIHEVRVSIDGSTVLSSSQDDALDSEDRAELEAADLPLADAIEIAIAEAPGLVDDAELDSTANATVWSIEIYQTTSSHVTLRIDAGSGEVLP